MTGERAHALISPSAYATVPYKTNYNRLPGRSLQSASDVAATWSVVEFAGQGVQTSGIKLLL